MYVTYINNKAVSIYPIKLKKLNHYIFFNLKKNSILTYS